MIIDKQSSFRWLTFYSQRDGRLSPRRLALALALSVLACCASILLNLAVIVRMLAAGAMVQALCWRDFRSVLGMVCAAQRPLAAGKSRQTSHDVGNGAGAVTLPVFVNRLLCGGLFVAEYPETVVYPALGPHPALFIGLMIAIAVLCSPAGASS